MDTILVKCPHCKEEMQAPADRESILCMFCGEKIDLTEYQAEQEREKKAPKKQQGDIAKSFENLNFVLEHVDKACEGYREKVKAFKKDTYYELFERYKEENYGFFTAMKTALDNAPEDSLEGVYRQIAGGFIRNQEEELARIKKKNDKFSMQMDKNMFMAIYVLPSMKEIHTKRADDLADTLCQEWGKSFQDSNIIASDYDSIAQGFKRKLCYITTAICRNLNKGEDCEELLLIKDFRDNYLSATKEGRALVEEYYDIAPTLVKRIAKSAEAQEKYLWLWNTYLAPCVAYIRAGKQEECGRTYREMVEELKKEYL